MHHSFLFFWDCHAMVSEQNLNRKYLFTNKVYWHTLLTNFTGDPWPKNNSNLMTHLLGGVRYVLHHQLPVFQCHTTWSVCQFLWKKTVFHFSWFFLFHNIESSIELVCLSSFWLHDTFTIDLTRKVKAQTELNFTKCLSHPPCLLISSAISFSFSCFLFSLQLTVLQVNVSSYPLFHSSFS